MDDVEWILKKARMGSRMGSTRGKENFRHPDNYGETKKWCVWAPVGATPPELEAEIL
jgi:hypothetical protein